MKKTVKRRILYTIGLCVSIIPPIAATLSYFPIWAARECGAALSGAVLLLLLICIVPLLKHIRRLLKAPSAIGLWLAVFLIFFALSKIADEVTVISFVGLISNLLGSGIMHFCNRRSADKT